MKQKNNEQKKTKLLYVTLMRIKLLTWNSKRHENQFNSRKNRTHNNNVNPNAYHLSLIEFIYLLNFRFRVTFSGMGFYSF